MVCDMAGMVCSQGSLPSRVASLILLHRACSPLANSAKVRAGLLACRIHARMDAIGLDTSGWSFLPKESRMARLRGAPTDMCPVAAAIVHV